AAPRRRRLGAGRADAGFRRDPDRGRRSRRRGRLRGPDERRSGSERLSPRPRHRRSLEPSTAPTRGQEELVLALLLRVGVRAGVRVPAGTVARARLGGLLALGACLLAGGLGRLARAVGRRLVALLHGVAVDGRRGRRGRPGPLPGCRGRPPAGDAAGGAGGFAFEPAEASVAPPTASAATATSAAAVLVSRVRMSFLLRVGFKSGMRSRRRSPV